MPQITSPLATAIGLIYQTLDQLKGLYGPDDFSSFYHPNELASGLSEQLQDCRQHLLTAMEHISYYNTKVAVAYQCKQLADILYTFCGVTKNSMVDVVNIALRLKQCRIGLELIVATEISLAV